MKNQRKHYTLEENVAILRRHLLDKKPISKLCGSAVGTMTSTKLSGCGGADGGVGHSSASEEGQGSSQIKQQRKGARES